MKEEYEKHKDVYNKVMRATFSNYEKHYWIDKGWFSDWVKGKGTAINNGGLLCEHNKVSPLKLNQMKLLPESSWVLLASCYDVDFTLSTDDCCLYCAAPIFDGLIFLFLYPFSSSTPSLPPPFSYNLLLPCHYHYPYHCPFPSHSLSLSLYSLALHCFSSSLLRSSREPIISNGLHCGLSHILFIPFLFSPCH